MKSLRLSEQQYASLKKRTVKLAAEVVRPQVEKPDRWPLVLRDQIVEAGLPEPFREFVWHPTRNWKFDLAWVEKRLAIECDGQVHRTRKRFESDAEKFAEAVVCGWIVLRVLNSMVMDGSAVELAKGLWRTHGK